MSCCGKNNYGREFDPECEAPSQADVARFGDDEGVTCGACGSDVYHDAALCGTCGHAMAGDEASGSKNWVAVTTVVVLVAFVLVFAL